MKKCIVKILILIIITNISLQLNIFAQEINQEQFKNITAPNLLLAQTDTGRILYEKNIDKKIYPASLTKLMTAILVAENCELDEIVTVSQNAVTSVPVGYVNANLQVGEELTVEDLLYVMLIPSANDAANALAEHTAGSIESFSTMMNTKAKELGCTGSNFTNPSGLHQEEHYTTTRDLFIISKAAISNNIIKKIIQTTIYTLPQTNKYTGTSRIFKTTNYMKKKELSKYYCDYCIGGKTGYTEYAKNCVVVFAKKDGIDLIAIVMGENAKIKGQKFLDAKEMFEYIYSNYTSKNISKANEVYEKVKILNGTKKTRQLEVVYKENINIVELKNINIENIDKKVQYTKVKAPINKGEIIGNITYKYEGIEYKTDLIAKTNVEESKVFRKIIMILGIILIIYIIYNLKKSNKKYKKHGKKFKRYV